MEKIGKQLYFVRGAVFITYSGREVEMKFTLTDKEGIEKLWDLPYNKIKDVLLDEYFCKLSQNSSDNIVGIKKLDRVFI